VPHRDALTAALEKIAALERELAERAPAAPSGTLASAIARLEEEKRALASERSRLVIERDRLVDDLAKAKDALARAEAESHRLLGEVEKAKAIRDRLRQQAIEEAARVGEKRK
jgi:hypothetical protein